MHILSNSASAGHSAQTRGPAHHRLRVRCDASERGAYTASRPARPDTSSTAPFSSNGSRPAFSSNGSRSSGSGNGAASLPDDLPSAPYTAVGRRDPAVAKAALQPAEQFVADPNEATFRHGGSANRIRLKDLLQADGGPPRFICPFVPGYRAGPDAQDLPLCFYLPGIDGTGLAASRQFPYLVRAFDLRCLSIPVHDRTPFRELVDLCLEYIEGEVRDCPVERPVYLLGESFGGVLAVAVAAARPDLTDRVVLVNPATSFRRSPWPALGPLLPQVPEVLYNAVPVALAPVLGNPLALASFGIDRSAPIQDQARALAAGLQALVPQLQALSEILPAPTLAWKLKLLDEGVRAIQGREADVQQRVLVLVGDGDLLIPSAAEGARLKRALPRSMLRVLPGRSHALLQEAGVDLVALLREEGFYVRRRALSAPLAERGRAGFGQAAPIELPTRKEVRRYTEGLQDNIRRMTSPVFFSRDRHGRVQRGLGGIPTDVRPLLLIGNHQTLAVDIGVLVEQIILERGILPRGLAHPAIFAGMGGTSGGTQNPLNNEQEFASFMSTFGAVPVGGRNFFRLMQNGEAVLLFPGGVREAYKHKGEEYRLFWPERAEFIRMAAKYGATIVPFAAVGAEDSIALLADSTEIPRIPFLGDRALRRAREEVPPARRGVAVGDEPDLFIAPVALPRAPERFYFLFQDPIELRPEDGQDRARTAQLYRQVKGSVEEGLQYLQEKRKRDPFRTWLPRWAYELSWGGKQAPTFPLD